MAARELLYRGMLLASSTVVAILVCEVGVRAYLQLRDPAVDDPGARLEASRRASPERPARRFGRGNLMGLVRPAADPETVYELKPGLSGRFLGQEFAFSSRGLRDREYPLAKPPGKFRIAGLGDSVMFGWGVGQSETYLELLERRLNEPASGRSRSAVARFEALNFAVPGYNTAMEAAVFERKALAFDPDLVVLHVVRNDLDLPPFLRTPRRLWTLERSYLLDLVRARLGGLRGLGEPQLVRAPPRDDGGGVPEAYRHMVGEEGFRRAMARLGDAARERSLPVIVLFSAREGEPWALVRRVVEAEGFHPLVTGPYYSDYLSRHGIEASPRGWAETFWLSRRDHHPNPLGHRLLAAALYEAVRDLGIL